MDVGIDDGWLGIGYARGFKMRIKGRYEIDDAMVDTDHILGCDYGKGL